MSTESFLPAKMDDHRAASPLPVPEWLAAWLPTRRQATEALQFQFEPPHFDEDGVSLTADTVWTTSMRQGLGLIILVGLVAGSLSFVVDWVIAARAGTALPLAELGSWTTTRAPTGEEGFWGVLVFGETMRTLAGLEPSVFPGWLAAGITSAGAWLTVPLRWLQLWIVYGALVCGMATVLGSRATLQRFFALTAYAVLPLLLTILQPIPCLGPIAGIIATVWSLVLYWVAVRAVTGLTGGQAVLCVLAPGALIVAGSLFTLFATLTSMVGYLM